MLALQTITHENMKYTHWVSKHVKKIAITL
jgi:hypothetical protein